MSSGTRDVHKDRFNFSKCSKCKYYKDLIDMNIKRSGGRKNLKKELNKHDNHQDSCRNVYHAWHHESKVNPQEVLQIMHDEMDTNKTTIPCLLLATKANARFFQLFVSLTTMITGGHDNSAYAHYTTNLWP